MFVQSLETIQSMIAKAERISNSEQDKFYHKRSCDDRSNKRSWRTSSSRIRNRSRSRSRSRERIGKYNTGQKQIYQTSKENGDYQKAAHMSSSSRIKKWKRSTNGDQKCESESSSSRLKETALKETELEEIELKETDADRISSANEAVKSENTGVLTEAEMNKLGARIIKAEIMGDEVRFAFLLLTFISRLSVLPLE